MKILFLCTGNSCRSQMAEGWCRHLNGNVLEPYSAGLEAKGLDPFAVKVMAESGVDISKQRSKHLDELRNIQFDYVITLCGDANERCPVFPAKTRVFHAGFDDPPRLAAAMQDEQARLDCYRRVRDEIRQFIMQLPELLY